MQVPYDLLKNNYCRMKTSILKSIVLALIMLVTYNVTEAANAKSSTVTNKRVPVIEFFSADTIVVVSPDNCSLCSDAQADIENAVFWQLNHYRPVYVYKTESQLTRMDQKQHLLFYGCLHQFNRKEFFNIPVRKTARGFQFKGNAFESETDEFFYINKSANRMYLCGNSPQQVHSFFSKGGTSYPLHIFSDAKVVLTGVI
jgi:hypothetical protein